MNLCNTQNRQAILANITHSLKISLAIHQICSTLSDPAAVNSGSQESNFKSSKYTYAGVVFRPKPELNRWRPSCCGNHGPRLLAPPT